MRNLFKKILPILLVLITLISLFGCGDDSDWKTYKEGEFVYTLPKDMKKLNIPASQADLGYGNSDNADFCVTFYTPQQLFDELSLEKDCSTEAYAEKYVLWYEYENVERKYDAENDITAQYYVYEDENLFFYDYIIRNENVLVHVWMVVDADKKDEYKPIFEYWTTLCYLK